MRNLNAVTVLKKWKHENKHKGKREISVATSGYNMGETWHGTDGDYRVRTPLITGLIRTGKIWDLERSHSRGAIHPRWVGGSIGQKTRGRGVDVH